MRPKETEISAALWALKLGKDFIRFTLRSVVSAKQNMYIAQ